MHTDNTPVEPVEKITRENPPFLKKNPPPSDFKEGQYIALVSAADWEAWLKGGKP